jgi:hypothetical protein
LSQDRGDHLIVPSLPVLYTPPAQFTDKTPVFTPLLVPALTAMAIGGIQWAGLSFIENAPIAVRIATFVIAAFILAVIQSREWLKFKGRYLFPTLLTVLVLLYLAICTYAFFICESR